MYKVPSQCGHGRDDTWSTNPADGHTGVLSSCDDNGSKSVNPLRKGICDLVGNALLDGRTNRTGSQDQPSKLAKPDNPTIRQVPKITGTMEGKKMMLAETPKRYPRLNHHCAGILSAFVVERLHQRHQIARSVVLGPEAAPSLRSLLHPRLVT